MIPNFKTSLNAYARHSQGAAYWFHSGDQGADIAPYRVAYFTQTDDDHPTRYRVPSPQHVARYLLADAIERAGLSSRSDISEAAHQGLSGVYRRFDGGLALRSDRDDYDANAPTPVLPLTDYYRGLHAALNFTFAADHPGNAGRPFFDRWDYTENIISATISEVLARRSKVAERATEETRKRAEAAAREADRRNAAEAAEEARSERDTIRPAYVIHAIREHLAALQPGDKMTRADLVDVVLTHAAADPLAPALPPRKVAAVLIQHAEELGLTERVLSSTTDGKRSRARGFVFTPQTTAVTENTQETTVDATTAHIIDRVVAELKDEVREHLTTHLARRSETAETTPSPVTDLSTYRARRAA